MALRDQPYLPLYVQDYMTDEKLNECSAEANGVYIRIMCLLHKSETYGKILLNQKHKQSDKQVLNFASMFAKHFPYSRDEIERGLSELIAERVMYFEDDFLCQKRMMRDGQISDLRAVSGQKGGNNSLGKKLKNDDDFAQAKIQANTEIEIESKIEIESNGKKNKKGVEQNWKTDFKIYTAELEAAYELLIKDEKFIKQQEELNPNLDIALSIKKGMVNFWGTAAGWKNKKKSKTIDIDWKATFAKTLDINKVYKQRKQQTTETTQVNDYWNGSK